MTGPPSCRCSSSTTSRPRWNAYGPPAAPPPSRAGSRTASPPSAPTTRGRASIWASCPDALVDDRPDAERAEVEILAAERLTAFSDAVVAIAITLLALGLPVPRGATNTELLRSAGDHLDDYLAFLISFAV